MAGSTTSSHAADRRSEICSLLDVARGVALSALRQLRRPVRADYDLATGRERCRVACNEAEHDEIAVRHHIIHRADSRLVNARECEERAGAPGGELGRSLDLNRDHAVALDRS